MSERKHPIETLDLYIDTIEANENERRIYISIRWAEKSIGFGDYEFVFMKDVKGYAKWLAYSEYMDRGEDKDFGRALWKRLLKYKESEPEEYKAIIKEDEEFLLKTVNKATGREDKELNEELLMKFMDIVEVR